MRTLRWIILFPLAIIEYLGVFISLELFAEFLYPDIAHYLPEPSISYTIYLVLLGILPPAVTILLSSLLAPSKKKMVRLIIMSMIYTLYIPLIIYIILHQTKMFYADMTVSVITLAVTTIACLINYKREEV